MTIYLLRGSHANEFELQNYKPIAQDLDIRVIAGRDTLTPVSLPVIHLSSPADLPAFPYKRQLMNRLIGGDQWLIGLEKYIQSQKKFDDSNHRTIMHTAETYTPYTHQAVQLKRRGVIDKLVCTCWETIPHNNEKFARLRRWKHEAYTYVDLFHTPTIRAKEALIAEGVDATKIVVIPYGIDLNKFRPRVGKSAHKRPVILTVARLEKEKGMEIIDQAGRVLRGCDFVVVGKGKFSPKGQNIRVQSIPYSGIQSVYNQADIFFFPSLPTATWEEQYGMALIEAMACGLPIVTTSAGAIPEVVGSDASAVVPSSAALVESLKQMIRRSAEWHQMGVRSRHRAMRLYDRNQIAKSLAKIY